MTKKLTPTHRTRKDMESRTPDEQDPDEGPISSEQARRELGFYLLPFNGTVGEDE